VKLDPREKQFVLLAFDSAAPVGESMAALRALFKKWLVKYPSGYEFIADLEKEQSTSQPAHSFSKWGEVTLRFGKYAGEQIQDIPTDYLCWVLENFEALWPETRRAIERYLEGDEK